MGFADKAKAAAEDAKGKVKEAAGDVLNDPEMKGEGKLDQAKAAAKKAGEDVKDAFN